MEEKDFFVLLDKIYLERGFDARRYRLDFVRRRIDARLRARRVASYREYARLLDVDAGEYRNLLVSLTVRLSRFFRDGETFRALRDLALAPLIRARREEGNLRLRAWSAGCAGGEETYSLAILIHELLRSEVERWTVQILGTDLDEEALAQAEEGVYGERSLREIDKIRLERYFESVQSPGRAYRVRPEIKALAEFRRHDLASDPFPTSLDLILCRNVLYYLVREEQERILRSFHEVLNEGGFLVIGQTEMLIPPISRLFTLLEGTDCIFRTIGR